METWNERSKVYEGHVFDVETGTVTIRNGMTASRDLIVHPGAVGVVPFTGHSVILVKQYRIAVGEYMLEIPAGKLEGDEDPADRARIELIEEAGYTIGTLLPKGFIYPSVAFLTEKIYLFLAFDLTETEAQPEWDEDIEVVEMPLAEVREQLAEGYFTDVKTIAGLFALLSHLDAA
jgi:ADP-ribose pyrophosphatase